MKNIDSVDLNEFILSIHKDNSVHSNKIEFGAPKEIKGTTIGLATMECSPPHNGERHNDGDEIIILLSGKIAVESDSNPDKCLELKPGDSCIIRKGEWHKIQVIEKAQLVYVTPGLNNEYRF
ncbi:cupin domain-containing protein [Pleionea sp. CnH1-48]|uniref:cupin domain-containing protein n=1 Tax=Pleionea sp. CnH1-48 TaxID=2954494 RepID=UPI002096944A|nr:cupin domain-containing protein [Pleionea sp. CnH1-48]MCO7226922.1 cupin domain-containing protein [Pleionea sp. CnH1-48]